MGMNSVVGQPTVATNTHSGYLLVSKHSADAHPRPSIAAVPPMMHNAQMWTLSLFAHTICGFNFLSFYPSVFFFSTTQQITTQDHQSTAPQVHFKFHNQSFLLFTPCSRALPALSFSLPPAGTCCRGFYNTSYSNSK